MLAKCKAIVIKSVAYSESSVVLKCYTDLYGLQSYLINGVRKSKGTIKPAQILPLSLLELEVYYQPNKNLHRIKELKTTPPLHELRFNLLKSAIGMFVSEVLHRSIKEENQPDNALFDFLYHVILLLNQEDGRVANFPIYFLIQLTRLLGFYPKYDSALGTENIGFNYKESEFQIFDKNNPFLFDEHSGKLLLQCLHCDYTTIQSMSFPASYRKALIQNLVTYFNEYLNGFSNMRSHEILAEVLE